MTPLIGIVLAMGLCYLAWGSFYFFFLRRGKDFGSDWIPLSVYFVFVGAVLAAIFWQTLAHEISGSASVPLVVLALFMLLQFVLHEYLPRYVRRPSGYFVDHPARHYLDLGWRRLISKSADIAAQQIFIVVLILFLKELGLSLPEIIFAFIALFALLHIPLIASERGDWPSWLFAGAVVAFGITFPPLILFVPYGFVYTFMIHWLFYTGSAIVFWLSAEGRLRSNFAQWCALLASVLIGAALVELASTAYVAALALLVCVVLLMEVRVRLGYTMPRGWFFYLHVSSGVLLGLALATVIYKNPAVDLRLPLLVVFVVMAATGVTLLARNLATKG